MFQKLQSKWNVTAVDLLLIIATFAIGGSFCGFVGRRLLAFTDIERGIVWVIIYVITISFLWPFSVLLVSIPLGQFSFFKKYLHNIYGKLTGKNNSTRKR